MINIKNVNELYDKTERILIDILSLINMYDYFYTIFAENMCSNDRQTALDLHDMLYISNKYAEQLSAEIKNVLD